jgi:pilus assembly protein CpaB
LVHSRTGVNLYEQKGNTMRLVFGLVLIIGVGLAGFAVYMAQGFISQMTAERDMLLAARAKAKPTVEIYAVTTPKAYGETLSKEDVTKIIWQEDSVPEGAFMKEEELFPEGKDARYVLRQMETFEPILSVKVTSPGEDAGITSRLGGGMQAFTINVDASSGVSGFLRPGDRVDVYWTGTVNKQKLTRLIQQGVELIAVDQTSDSGRSSPVIARTVTVKVSREQVVALATAESTGDLSLSLVGAEDDSFVEGIVQIDRNTLLGIVEEEEIVAQKERICTTIVRRGAERIEQRIPCPVDQ